MKPQITKKTVAMFEDYLSDEHDWFDFKYVMGMLLKQKFDRYVKVSLETNNPFTGEPRRAYKYVDLGFASDAEEYGGSFISELTHEIGTMKVYNLTNRKGLYIVHTHHDNPVNGDRYTVTPISERTFRAWYNKF